ncbi:Allergen V5/Tpx-1 related protein (plasmid) [Jannaschia sp. CCS1]|nr:Allergen V5/Tpx-1 related protein [Jannaschia sp. CCS1]
MSFANQYEWQMLALINAERAKVGADPLRLEITLNLAAENHSDWMIATDTFSHTGVGSSDPGVRIEAAGFDASRGYGWAENIAARTLGGPAGYADEIVGLHQQLMNSPGHRANLLNPAYDFIGIGFEVGEYQGQTWAFVTQKFVVTNGSVDVETANVTNYELQFNSDFNQDGIIGLTPAEEAAQAGAQIYRMYRATLDREPDLGGYEQWVQVLKEGTSGLQDIASRFMASAEFQQVYGALSDTQFVTLLYNNVLDRAPDSAGLESWVSLLSGGADRAQVVLGFSESAEFANTSSDAANAYTGALAARHETSFLDDVFRLYQATLGREPDSGGLQGWTEQLAEGKDYLSIVSGFTNSPEFVNTYGSLTDEAFVDLMYLNVLNRGADSAGQQHWLNLIGSGGTREQVVQGFAQSAEFITNTEQNFTTYMGSLEGDVLSGNTGDDILLSGYTADTFVFDADEDGKDTVLQFDAWDTLQFEGFGYTKASDALAHMQASGSNVMFSDQGVDITFFGTDLSVLEQADFIFA